MSIGYDRYFEASGHWGRRYEDLDPGERARVDAIVGAVPRSAATVLDVGCGDGLVTDLIGAAGFAVTGTDISEEALRHVAATTVLARAESLPFENRAFDCVVASDLLEHLPSGAFEATVTELARVASHAIVVNAPHEEDLAVAATKCSRCETVFHASRHARSIARVDVERWFPQFRVEAWQLTGVAAPKRIARVQRIAQAAGDVYYRPPDAVCPTCGYDVEPPRPNPFARVLNAILQRALTAHRKGRPSEFVAVLRRTSDAP